MERILQEINIIEKQIETCKEINREKIFKLKQDFVKKIYEASGKKHYSCPCGCVILLKSKKEHYKSIRHHKRLLGTNGT